MIVHSVLLDMYLHNVYTFTYGGFMTSAVITKWGNSNALRIQSKMLKKMGIDCNDKVYLETSDNKIIITKIPTPRKGTLEYLFKDYSGESFKTALINPAEPVGNEKW